MAKPKVSMIVSNFNGIQLNLIKDCINSLTKPNYSNWELVVIDNSSSDSSVAYLKNRLKGYKNSLIVANQINMYSQGLNLGARYASGKYLAYFNNDTSITKKYLVNLVREFERDDKLAIAQGKLLNYKNHTKIDSAGETMDIFGNPHSLGSGEKDKGQYDAPGDILSASGSACMIRKNIFEKLGGYDNIFGIGYEDMDLALRARRCGYKIKRFPKAIVYHKRGATDLAPFIRTEVKWHFNKNRLITMLKNYPVWLLFISLPVTILLYKLIILYEWIIQRNWNMGRVRLTSLIWVIFHLPDILVSRNKIKKIGAKSLSKKDYALFSSKSLFSNFRQFI